MWVDETPDGNGEGAWASMLVVVSRRRQPHPQVSWACKDLLAFVQPYFAGQWRLNQLQAWIRVACSKNRDINRNLAFISGHGNQSAKTRRSVVSLFSLVIGINLFNQKFTSLLWGYEPYWCWCWDRWGLSEPMSLEAICKWILVLLTLEEAAIYSGSRGEAICRSSSS